ncbi:hypothetical protein GQ457_15G012930 [Hibiscus cannabinus]
MFFDVLSPIPKPVLRNSNPMTPESDPKLENASARDSADRSSAQPGSSRSVQPRQPVITRSQTAADRDTDLQ